MQLLIDRIDEEDEGAKKSPVQIKIQLALGMECCVDEFLHVSKFSRERMNQILFFFLIGKS